MRGCFILLHHECRDNFPTDAAVVIIGGGVIGCSLAYHLAKAGVEGVLLLERKRLTCGTTWHAAGLVPRLRSTPQLTALTDYSVGLYKSLEAETGLATGFRQNGSLGVTLSAQRLKNLNAWQIWVRPSAWRQTF